ncbi:MAG: ATP-binding protein [Thermoproteota archaeon]|nr:ATP-binding protein [Thermoproteota archaeon]
MNPKPRLNLLNRFLPYKFSSSTNFFINFTVLPAVLLTLLTIWSLNPGAWKSSEIHHFYIELIAVILGSTLSFYYILHARVLKDEFSLFLGIGFLVCSLIDLLHVMVSYALVENMDFLRYFIPQTWFAGRIFLSAMLLIAVTRFSSSFEAEAEEEEEKPKQAGDNNNIDQDTYKSVKKERSKPLIFMFVLGVFASSVALSSLFLVFPAAVLDDYSLHRPYEIPPLVLFSITLFFFYKKRLYLKKDVVYKGLAAYLVVDIFAQIIMSFSANPFDTAHNVSHVLKDVGYFVNIIALAVSSIRYSTRLKEINDLIKLQYEQLKESEKMKADFINIAAHELRTPVQPILILSELFDLKSKDSHLNEIDTVKKDMEVINRNAKKLQKITNDILDITKIESHSLRIEKTEFDLYRVIVNAIRDCMIEIEKRKQNTVILCKCDFNRKPANEDESIVIEADKNRINQVLSNLLNNAIKFTDNGSISVTIEKGKEEVVVNVIDEGPGIRSTMFPKLFTKFTTDSASGTGLGLYISKSIIEAHGGRIWAQNNNDGRGATFSFSLPLKLHY